MSVSERIISRRYRSRSCGEAFPSAVCEHHSVGGGFGGKTLCVSPLLQRRSSHNSDESLARGRGALRLRRTTSSAGGGYSHPEDSSHTASRENGAVNAFGSHITDTSSSSGFSSCSSVNFFDGRIQLSLPEPPDGGWGWMVVFASFICHTVADGVPLSFGILFVELSDIFNESKSYTALVGALMLAVPAIFAPITSALINEYGCRVVCMCGSVLCTCGYLLAYFMDSIFGLIFSIGIITGVGQSLILLPSIVIVANYFYVKRAFAMGLSIAGLGVGTFIFAPVLEILLAQYTWRGTMLLLAGIYLNLLVCGALYRPVESQRKKQRRRRLIMLENLARKSGLDLTSCKDYENMDVYEKIVHLRKRLLSTSNNNSQSFINTHDEEEENTEKVVTTPTSGVVVNEVEVDDQQAGKEHCHANNSSTSRGPILLNSPPRLATILEGELLETTQHGRPTLKPSESSDDPNGAGSSSGGDVLKEVRFDICENESKSGDEEEEENEAMLYHEDEPLDETTNRSSQQVLASSASHSMMMAELMRGDSESTATTSLKSHSMSDLTLLNTLLLRATTTIPAMTQQHQMPSDPELYRRKCCNGLLPSVMSLSSSSRTATTLWGHCLMNSQHGQQHSPPHSPTPSIIQSFVSLLVNSPHFTNTVHKLQRQEVRNALARYNMRRNVPIEPSNFPLASCEPSHVGDHHHLAAAGIVDTRGPFHRQDVFFRGSLLRLNRLERRQRRTVSLPMLLPSTDRIPEGDGELETFGGGGADLESNWDLSSGGGVTRCRCNGVYDLLLIKRMMDLTVFHSVYFAMFFVSNFLLFIFFNIVNFYMVDYVQTIGHSMTHGAMLMSALGIASTIGQVLVGFLADRDGVNILVLYAVCITICGIGTILVPCSNDYAFLIVYSALFGLNIAANDALTSVILAEFMGLEKLTNAMGIIMFGQGMGNVLGPPLIGLMIDVFSYNSAFVICGLGITASAMCVFLVVIYENRHLICVTRYRNGENYVSTSSGSSTSFRWLDCCTQCGRDEKLVMEVQEEKESIVVKVRKGIPPVSV